MVEIEMGRDQQIDVTESDTELGQALHDVILRSGVVRVLPPWRARGLADEHGRVAGIDQDCAPTRRADQVARNLGEVGLTCAGVRQPELSEMEEVELMSGHQEYSPFAISVASPGRELYDP